jgi:predicted molibdopterin-dependent oxidoreductase YjgC
LKSCEEQNGKCKLTNIDFTFKLKETQKNFNPFNPSIDRIDSSKGYTKDNVRIVCVIVNLALNEFGEENFKIMCQSYINYQLELGNTTIV